MATGFDQHIAMLERLAPAAVEASKAAVSAGLQPIYERSQEYVGVDKGTLKLSGKVTEPEATDGVISAAVVYGNEDTVTDWNGVGYEIFHEFGTDHGTYTIDPRPFLEVATMESIPEIPALMGAAFDEALAGALQ